MTNQEKNESDTLVYELNKEQELLKDKKLIEKVIKKELGEAIDPLSLLKDLTISEDSEAVKIRCSCVSPASCFVDFIYDGKNGYRVFTKLKVAINKKGKNIYLEQFRNSKDINLVKPTVIGKNWDEVDRLYENLEKVLHTLNGFLLAKYEIFPDDCSFRFKIPL